MLPEHKTRREQLETSLLHSGRHRQPAASLLLSGGTLKTSPLARLPQNLSTEALQHLGVKKAQQTAEKHLRPHYYEGHNATTRRSDAAAAAATAPV